MALDPGIKIMDGKYRVLRKLAEGRFGHVYKIEHTQTGEYFALKSISRKEIQKNNDLRTNILREIRIHQSLDHPNIVKLIETGKTNTRKFIILEYMPLGDLWDLLHTRYGESDDNSNDSSSDSSSDSSDDSSEDSSKDSSDDSKNEKSYFSEEEARDYFYQLIQALIYLRARRIVHRDIKPENILITDSSVLKLADFGWATDHPSSSHVGTTRYNSPEMIFSSHNYTYKTDIWSCGILLYEFLFGDTPFYGKRTKSIEDRINNGAFTFPKNIPSSNEVRDLIKKLLAHRPENRPDYEDILCHPWMQPIQETLCIDTDDNCSDDNHSDDNHSDTEVDKIFRRVLEDEIDAELQQMSLHYLH